MILKKKSPMCMVSGRSRVHQYNHVKHLSQPTAPMFLRANLHPIPFFVPTTIHHPLPPPPPYPLLLPPPPPPPPPPLPLTSLTPTRAVLLLSLPSDVTESSIRRNMELFGPVRGVQMERANEGLVTVHFYNLKDSKRAFNEIRKYHMQQQEQVRFHTGLVYGRFVWAEFVFPQFNAVPHGKNQGSLVIMNMEPNVSSTTLRQVFQSYGEVKEIRGTPFKNEQRFVEYFDVRHASLALREMDGTSIAGKAIVVQFSHPGGISRRLYLASRSNKNFFFNDHLPPPPPRLSHHHRQLPSPRKLNPRRNKIQLHEQQEKKKTTKKYVPKNVSDACYIISGESSGEGDIRCSESDLKFAKVACV